MTARIRAVTEIVNTFLSVRRLSALIAIVGIVPAAASCAVLRSVEIYRAPAGTRAGLAVWIVDGATVRREIYPEFVFGGNAERYLFVPRKELWIDHAISVEEFEYTLAHETYERQLMARRGWAYAVAHDSALALEQTLRHADARVAKEHEHACGRVSPTDCDGVKEIDSLPDSISLSHVYRIHVGERNGAHVWIVDGATVRRDVFPDFGFSGNDRAFHFIPVGEIWLDNVMACEEMEIAIAAELEERQRMIAGEEYDTAYAHALNLVATLRAAAQRAVIHHPPLRFGMPRDRDFGTGREHPSGTQ